MVSVASLFLMGASLTTSALGSTGTTAATVSAAATNFIYPVSANLAGGLPTGVTSLAYTSAADVSAHTAVLPSWAPTFQSAGSVTQAGDLALVNGAIASNGIVVSMYVTNLASLQQDYSSFAFPVDVWVNTCATSCLASQTGTTTSTGWLQDTSVIPSLPTYLTSTTGYITFNLPAGVNTYYDIAIDTGGSYYCTSLTTSGTASLTPTFYFTAEPY